MKKERSERSDLKDFEETFRYFYPRMKKYAYYFLNDEAEAEDIVQDAFYQLWINKKPVHKNENTSSFLFTFLKNRCFNLLRRRIVKEKYLLNQSFFESEQLYQLSFDSDGTFVPMKELLHNELMKIISQMPEKSGIAFTLKWIEGKKIREIAEEMQVSTTMVDKYLAKGLAFMKENLDSNLFYLFMLISKN